MPNLIVVNNPKNWTFEIPGVELVSAKSYLSEEHYSQMRQVRIFNLCKSYRYQSIGYYVSLLASARGHKPLPNITTIQDMKSQTLIRFVDDDLDELIQKNLSVIEEDSYNMSIYFGRSVNRQFDRLALHLYNLFPAPLLKAEFLRGKDGWHLHSIDPVSTGEIPEEHYNFLVEVATGHFSGRVVSTVKRRTLRYDLAILWDPEEKEGPSNEKAIKRFISAGEKLGLNTEVISRDDYGRIAEYDALFIRETTSVNHHTYRFARRAEAEGLVVVDNPESILRCSNKVYLAELLDCHNIPTPKTSIAHKDNLEECIREIGVPCVLKQPDSAFSQGVLKTETEEMFMREANRMLSKSDLIVVQEYLPTDFDWRVGIFDRKPLFVCKYFMARNHWQIIKRDPIGRKLEGRFETLPVELAPFQVIRLALKAANLIGDGLYGVDIKQVDKKYYIMEINDNPNVDAGIEDLVAKQNLYDRIMEVFLKRILTSKNGIAY
ncbi:MAG: RimK family protein [Fibrobacter sp.]|jgi:glutathione synthase/RimK-type ligase-like ATP-grasp enzyme|nr:RimK family protein [Fibrobacter sp.]